MGLDDAVRVSTTSSWPAAENISTEKQSTIGEQRRFNYACQPMSQDAFVAVVTEGQPSAPAYFLYNATLNKQDRDVRDVDQAIRALDHGAVDAALADGAVIHDARPAADFTGGHIRGAISVPADGRMAETAGMVLRPEQRIVVVAPRGRNRTSPCGSPGSVSTTPSAMSPIPRATSCPARTRSAGPAA